MVCGKCGRALKSQESQQTGYGPVCYKNLFGSSPKKGGKDSDADGRKEFDDYVIPGQMEISDFVSDFLHSG